MGDILFQPQDSGCFCTPEGMHRLNFHCGAWLYVQRGDPAVMAAGKRLIVYASKCVGIADTPNMMGAPKDTKAPCLFGCPCRTKARRKQVRAWGREQNAQTDELGVVVSCKIESIDKPSLCIECRKRRCQSDEDELCDRCFGRNRK